LKRGSFERSCSCWETNASIEEKNHLDIKGAFGPLQDCDRKSRRKMREGVVQYRKDPTKKLKRVSPKEGK